MSTRPHPLADDDPAPRVPDFAGDAVDMTRGALGADGRSGFVVAVALAAVVGAVAMLAASVRSGPTPVTAAATAVPDPSRLVLNALLVPALDSEALPLRWVDPRLALRCGAAAEVRVDRAPLVVGALVPDSPFEIEWRTDDCRPFGAAGPRFDGHVRLTVFREEWGFSAIVEPQGLRVDDSGRHSIWTQPFAAVLPSAGDVADTPDPVPPGD